MVNRKTGTFSMEVKKSVDKGVRHSLCVCVSVRAPACVSPRVRVRVWAPYLWQAHGAKYRIDGSRLLVSWYSTVCERGRQLEGSVIKRERGWRGARGRERACDSTDLDTLASFLLTASTNTCEHEHKCIPRRAVKSWHFFTFTARWSQTAGNHFWASISFLLWTAQKRWGLTGFCFVSETCSGFASWLLLHWHQRDTVQVRHWLALFSNTRCYLHKEKGGFFTWQNIVFLFFVSTVLV